MKKLLRIPLRALSFLFYLAPYPHALGYHFIVGASLRWWLKGAPHSYSIKQVLLGGGIGLVVGALGCIVFGYLLTKVEEQEAQ